jgi:cobalt-zinc-cadmium efflux system outer membrane protein
LTGARGAAPFGALDTSLVDDEGPQDGLTLDAAIERMMAANLDIRALRHELPQADADIVTAGLRTNPLIYLDGQFIPYGSFNDATPGGPTQYDVNITYPVDVSHKRQSRTIVARMARTALEAQFQDVVRRQIGNVGNAFVNLQGARLAMLSAEAAVKRHRAQLAEARRTARPDAAETADLVEHEAFLVEQATLSLIDATEAFEDAQESLAVLLNEPPETTGLLQPRGSLRHDIRPPPLEELTSVALKCRPDIRSMRAGVSRANAEVALQRANRFDDIYLFYDPITIQDNRPIHAPNSKSWAVGVTFALPIYNRNQGNISRAISNVQQTRQELSAMERRVASEVRLAEREYQTSKRALEQIEKTMLPQLQASLRRRAEQFAKGDISLEDYQSHVEESTEVAQSHRDALIRQRRSMVDLNTAVGLRVLP